MIKQGYSPIVACTMTVILKNVSFKYPNSQKMILDNVSFELAEGSYLSVLGENGSGKSTLIKLILGLYKAKSGTVICNARRVGYVPQQKLNFFQLPVTVSEFLAAAKHALKLKDKLAEQRVLYAVGMEHKAAALLGTLSGGELQRVFIAQALLGQPELLILDEPSTGVDVENQTKLYHLLHDLNTQKHLTIIAVEHNLPAAVQNSTEIFHLENGAGHACSPRQYADEYLHASFLQDIRE